jgi:hypothetical protein
MLGFGLPESRSQSASAMPLGLADAHLPDSGSALPSGPPRPQAYQATSARVPGSVSTPAMVMGSRRWPPTSRSEDIGSGEASPPSSIDWTSSFSSSVISFWICDRYSAPESAKSEQREGLAWYHTAHTHAGGRWRRPMGSGVGNSTRRLGINID